MTDEGVPDPSARVRLAFAIGNAVAAVVLAVGVTRGLPARYLPVDILAGIVALLLAASAYGLFARTPWSETVARVSGWIVLGVGLALLATLSVTASYVSGIYGPIGRGAALIMGLVMALAVPYLVILPAAQLVWLGPTGRRTTSRS
jgi:hypothetical protein